jgi:cysteinyl-tRNA synthetase
MALDLVGERFGTDVLDIHAGGVDLIFPHHEDEIAQSCAYTGKPDFARFWLHGEFLNIRGTKMSKRFGNFYTLRDLLANGYDPIAIRYLLMSTHYRQQFNFTFEGLESAKGAVDRLRNFVRRLHEADGKDSKGNVATLTAKLEACFGGSMDDDLNIGIALASLFDFVREINSLLDANLVSRAEAAEVGGAMMRFDEVLGVIGKVEVEEALPTDIDALVQKREAARKAKDWKEADAIRAQLKAMGIVLEDTAQGVRWHKERA